MEKIINEIARYIVTRVQNDTDRSMSGFQMIINHMDIQERFAKELDEAINLVICDALYSMEEVMNVELDSDGFDVVIGTDYAPNYDEEQFDNWREKYEN